MSGAFDISDFFNGYYDDNIYFNSPYDYLPNMPDPWKLNHMSIIIATGEWDNTRHESLRMSRDSKLEGNQPLVRRSEMVRSRLELLARDVAVLFVEAFRPILERDLHRLSPRYINCVNLRNLLEMTRISL